MDDRKRKADDGAAGAEPDDAKKPRKSRFDGGDGGSAAAAAAAVPTIDIAAAAAAAKQRALEISRNLMQNHQQPQLQPPGQQVFSGLMPPPRVEDAFRAPGVRAAKNITLRLDALGREIDEYGNVVKTTTVKSTIANVAVEKEKKKKENPYLAHRAPRPLAAGVPGVPVGAVGGLTSVAPPGMASVLPPAVPGVALAAGSAADDDGPIDDRIVVSNRSKRGKRALHFVEAGKYVQREEKDRLKEERKIIAGFSSGRKAPEVTGVF